MSIIILKYRQVHHLRMIKIPKNLRLWLSNSSEKYFLAASKEDELPEKKMWYVLSKKSCFKSVQHTAQHNTIRYNTIWGDTVRYVWICDFKFVQWSGTIQYDIAWYMIRLNSRYANNMYPFHNDTYRIVLCIIQHWQHWC